MRVLHVLDHSIPSLTGYAIRGKYIVETQRREGLDPVVVTGPFHRGVPGMTEDRTIDGTRYHRIPHPADVGGRLDREGELCRWLDARGGALGGAASAGAQVLLMRRFEREVLRVAREVRPDVVHAHSPYRCGVVAAHAARQLGVPLVYEIRGLWEDSFVADGTFREGGVAYRWYRANDTRVMRAASAVICISRELRREVTLRGVSPERIFVVPNAADPEIFSAGASGGSLPPDVLAVRARLHPGRDPARGDGVEERPTLGYIGNVRKLEGVDGLLRGAAEIRRRGREISVLVVGDGPALASVRALAAELGLGERAVFTGRVPHDQVMDYYRLIDVFVVSRPALRVTELVTPLKPLEAMAMGVPLVVTDLPALREIVEGGETGMLYPPGDAGALADRCLALLDDPVLAARLAGAASRWVRAERTWSVCLRGLGEVYRTAIAAHGRRS